MSPSAAALADFDRSLTLAPNSSSTHWGVAMYYALTGERKKALSELAQAIRINSIFKQKAKNDKFFQSLWNDGDFRKLVD